MPGDAKCRRVRGISLFMKGIEMENDKTYPINEIFYSLQGEGYYTGRPAIFIRFSGCNLSCPFCDTFHHDAADYILPEIIEKIEKYPKGAMVVLTGGEPSLYVDSQLIDALHHSGRYITIETNGTNPLPEGIDWITWSPKIGMTPGADRCGLRRADEIKVVNVGQDLQRYFDHPLCQAHTRMYLQPCFTPDDAERERNLADTISKVKADPRWTLSAQMHRYLNIR